MKLHGTLSFVAWCAISAGISQAQTKSAAASGAIDGVVTDTSDVVLDRATVSILASGVQVVTGENGRFRIVALPAGHYIVVVRHLGHAPFSTVVQVADGDTARVSFALKPVAIALNAVTVSAARSSTRIAGFDERRKFGFGHFVTQSEIEERNTGFVADLIRNILSVRIKELRRTQIAFNARAGACPFQIWVDDVLMPTPTDLADLPSPKLLAGIEVYSGPATVPLQYKRADSQCGAILLWTKDGS